MSTKLYLIKTLTPWMMDELIAFSRSTKYSIIFLRKPEREFEEGVKLLINNNINILIKPFKINKILQKLIFLSFFCLKNLNRFYGGYNTAIGIKSVIWFLRLDLDRIKRPVSIHAQYATQAALICYLLKKYFPDDVEYYFTFHAHDIFFNNKWFCQITNLSDKAFSISDYNINYVLKKYNSIIPEKITLSRLGVFQEKINVSQENKETNYIIGFLSWFNEKKGLIYLLNAIKKLNEDFPFKYKLVIAGRGPLEKMMLTYIRKNNLSSAVNYIGVVGYDSKKNYYKSIDVFILPAIKLKNDMDGIPVVLMDAVSYGLPIITTNISGLPEICINDFNGILINEKNIDEIYWAIINLFQNRSKYIAYSSNSLKIAAQYNLTDNSYNKLKILKWIK